MDCWAVLSSSSATTTKGTPDLVPGIYERLIDEDGVDLVIGGYGTNALLPAMSSVNSRTGRGGSTDE
ncbi:hypothetical protein [Streptomyces sp. NPDC059863]|uniref:hypothetical protein n=1 Tax=unclassified Streptomyces TaxID=2593676 RepID=UPI0036501AB7